jgi:hypothetical protein
MAWKLSSVLVARGQLSVSELCGALVRQAIGGGALDTVLLERELVSEHDLIEAIAQAKGFEPMPADLDEAIDPAAAEELPALAATIFGVCPLRRRDDTLEILASEQTDFLKLEELAFELGCTITAYAATEVRVSQARNLLYGEPVPPRLAALLDRLGPRPAVDLRQYLRYLTAEERAVVEKQLPACDMG